MMLRFTTMQVPDLTPGDLCVNAFAVDCVTEHEFGGGVKVAMIHVYGVGCYTVIDPNRDAAERIATARGQYEDMPRC